jgi:hypothetical protein
LPRTLEEIAHPVEEQAILGIGLEREILRHHRRGGGACMVREVAGFSGGSWGW